MLALALGALSCLVVSACAAPPVSSSELAVVYGVDDRREVYEHPSAAHRAVAQSAVAIEMSARSVDESNPSDVRITYRQTLGEAQELCAGERFADQIEPGTCSGTLIDDRHILTAGHCVDEAADCDGSRVWILGFYYSAAGTLRRLTRDDVYRCSRVIAFRYDGEADHAIVELDRPVVGHTPAPVRPVASLGIGTELVLIGHPNGIPMKIAGGGQVTVESGLSLNATLDAFSGNSGSGVFDTAGNLVALLDSGEDDYVARGACNVVLVIDPPPTDDGEGLTFARPAIEAYCATPGIVSSLCDCGGVPCVPGLVGDVCADAEALGGASTTRRASLSGYAADVSGSCSGAGPDRAYTLTLASPSHVVVTLSGFDTVLHITRGCGGAEVGCHDDVSDSDRGSRLELDLEAGTYVVWVDAYDGEVGTFDLRVEVTPTGDPVDASSPPASDGGAASMADAGRSGPSDAGGGCGCRASRTSSPAAPTLLLVVLAWSYGRRRRRDG